MYVDKYTEYILYMSYTCCILYTVYVYNFSKSINYIFNSVYYMI